MWGFVCYLYLYYARLSRFKMHNLISSPGGTLGLHMAHTPSGLSLGSVCKSKPKVLPSPALNNLHFFCQNSSKFLWEARGADGAVSPHLWPEPCPPSLLRVREGALGSAQGPDCPENKCSDCNKCKANLKYVLFITQK